MHGPVHAFRQIHTLNYKHGSVHAYYAFISSLWEDPLIVKWMWLTPFILTPGHFSARLYWWQAILTPLVLALGHTSAVHSGDSSSQFDASFFGGNHLGFVFLTLFSTLYLHCSFWCRLLRLRSSRRQSSWC